VPEGGVDLANDGQRHEIRLTTAPRQEGEWGHAAD
jgi:hypothetical protein